MDRFQERLIAAVAPFAQVSVAQADELARHCELMLRWNQRMNLTRIEDPDEVVRFHYGESLYLAAKLPGEARSLIDVGTGAGFPGVPIAVYRPDIEVTLLESNGKKAAFLREATTELKNVRVVCARLQDVQDRYDIVVSRAVDPKEVLRSDLAPIYALLLSSSDAPAGSYIEKLPWGDDRVLCVPRGTL